MKPMLSSLDELEKGYGTIECHQWAVEKARRNKTTLTKSSTPTQDWMAAMHDHTLLSDLTIPGTHSTLR